MQRKYFIIIGIVAVFLLILLVIIFLQPNPTQQQVSPKASTVENQNSSTFHKIGTTTNTASNTTTPSVSLAPPSDTAQGAVEQFYHYYFSFPTNPLANGAYKTNQYLSSEFKDIVGSLYDNGNDPVFCLENERKNIIVGQEAPIDFTNALLMQEIISEAPPGKKDLYRVSVQNVNNSWLIYDINCIR